MKIISLTKNSHGQFFAAAENHIFISTDKGITWIETNSDASHLEITCLVSDESNYIFAGATSSGILRTIDPTLIDSYQRIIPIKPDLSPNYPNPFNPTTAFNYQMPQAGFVSLKVYDVLGREVATLVNEEKSAGRYTVNFEAPDLASGIYIYQLRVNDYESSKKMLLLK